MKSRYLKSATMEELRQNVPNNLERYRSGSFEYLVRISRIGSKGRSTSTRTSCARCMFPTPRSSTMRKIVRSATERCRSSHRMRHETSGSGRTSLTHSCSIIRESGGQSPRTRRRLSDIYELTFLHEIRDRLSANAASRLWWMARLCQRVSGIPLEECLEVLLYRSDVRANIIERPTVSLNSVVFGAIIRKLHSSYKGQKRLFDRVCFRGLMRRINSIGGVKLLDCMNEQQLGVLTDEIVSRDLDLVSF